MENERRRGDNMNEKIRVKVDLNLTEYVSFLRGINVGGTTKIKMIELKNLYEELGCSDVKTFLQTGNVLFKVSKLPNLTEVIKERFGCQCEVIVRKLSQINKIIEAQPFAKFKTLNPSWQIVMFLAAKPDLKGIRSIVRNNEELWIKGKELYITFPEGIGRSKLTIQKIEKALGVLGTMRNGNTLNKIILDK